MTSFTELGATTAIAAVLERQQITVPTPIQEGTIPPALDGRDVCGKAPTGSGKTIAFGIPLSQLVDTATPGRPCGLVLVPTRELAAQVERELRPLLRTRNAKVASFYGGVGFGNQLRALRQSVDVAVACPGRLADLIQRGDISLGDVRFVVIDEADRMADMGFLPEVRKLLDQVRDDRQTLLFSATLDGDVNVLIERYQTNPVMVDVTPHVSEPDRTEHLFLDVDRADRTDRTAQLIARHGSTVVFTRTRHGADRLAKRLTRNGVHAVPIHGGRSQGQRDRALAAFTKGDASALVATDVAARGIHVDDVSCVIHFDVPADSKDYVHRSGRTGRAGAEGTVITFVTEDDGDAVYRLRRDLDVGDGPPSSRPTGGAKKSGGGQRNAGPRRNGSASGHKPKSKSSSSRGTSGGGTTGGKKPGGPSSQRRSKGGKGGGGKRSGGGGGHRKGQRRQSR